LAFFFFFTFKTKAVGEMKDFIADHLFEFKIISYEKGWGLMNFFPGSLHSKLLRIFSWPKPFFFLQ